MLSFVFLALVLPPGAEPSPEERAVAALAREVKAWRPENRCCSCHENADGARALYRAVAAGFRLPPGTLEETTAWLADPAGWKNNGGEGPFNDKNLATLQFAHALAVAVETGHRRDPAPLREAARWVADLQQPDGSWKADSDDVPGSPASHGRPLATALALHTLCTADAQAHTEPIRRAGVWLRTLRLENVYQAAGVLLGLGQDEDEGARRQRETALDLIRRGEARPGGWGPYVRGATESFDTALVLIALASQKPTEEIREWLRRGRTALLAGQEKDGTWPATTRPTGGESNAQRVATTAWALSALLQTRGR